MPDGTSVYFWEKKSHELAFSLTYRLSFVGRLRYANNSNYKKDQMIRKEVCIW